MNQLLQCLKTARVLPALLMMLCTAQFALAQNRQIVKGVIRDARNKEPVIGAVITP
jgi:predicted rRNA methylase YqxC with S4 and FtsJ domains